MHLSRFSQAVLRKAYQLIGRGGEEEEEQEEKGRGSTRSMQVTEFLPNS